MSQNNLIKGKLEIQSQILVGKWVRFFILFWFGFWFFEMGFLCSIRAFLALILPANHKEEWSHVIQKQKKLETTMLNKISQT